MPVQNLHDDCEAHRAISELKTKWSWVCDHFGLWSCNEVALPGIFAGVRVFNRKATATGRLVWKWAMHSTRLLSLIIKYSHSSAASDGHTQHQIHFYNMKLTFALHEILLPRFNGGYIPLPHTPLIDLGLLWFIHCIHCDSLRFMGHIGPHQLNCALCASCLPPRNCWSSLCLLPPVKLLQGSQLTQTRNDRHMDCAAVCVIVRFEYFESKLYFFTEEMLVHLTSQGSPSYWGRCKRSLAALRGHNLFLEKKWKKILIPRKSAVRSLDQL